jgi:hypothetical protein
VNERSLRALRIVLGQGGPPRDERGRFVAVQGGDDPAPEQPKAPPTARAYDGGVRPITPAPRDPEREHAALILGLVSARRAVGGGEAFVVG